MSEVQRLSEVLPANCREGTTKRPDWSLAPRWANYLAMDESGDWWWFESKPENKSVSWQYGGQSQKAEFFYKSWVSTLMVRP